jgi:hypothetical protein
VVNGLVLSLVDGSNVCRGGVVGSRVSGSVISGLGVSSGLVVVSLGVTVVLNISDVTGVAIDVIVDGLLAAIGKNNGVRAGGLVTIAGLVLAHVNVGVVVLDGPVIFVVSGGLKKIYVM